MDRSFNLLDAPWLPVRLADGQVAELGLLEAFRRSGEIVALAETAPPNLVAEYRLLLAILHRALSHGRKEGWKLKDRARWYRDGLPVETVCDYLEHWRERFWLFHPEHPFLQVAALATATETRDKRKPWTQIALASANGNAPVVFDHAHDGDPQPIRPADAFGTLLGFLQFTPGGLVKTVRDADKAGPLVNTAAVIPMGATLARTLALCLHPAPGLQAEDDLPAWERAPLTLEELRGAPVPTTGPNDRYTRQSRAVLLMPEADGDIRWLRFAAGFALGEDAYTDPMASFRHGDNGKVRLTFREGRALWRDLPVLVPTPTGERPAAVIEYALALHARLDEAGSTYQPLLVAGVASDQAKLLRWRAERIALPVALLEDPDKALYLRRLVERADALFGELRGLATSMLAETLPSSSSKDTRARARALLEAGPFAPSYFALLERALPDMLSLLAEGHFQQADTLWTETLRRSAKEAWLQALTSQGRSLRVLRADAKYLSRFHGLLSKHAPARIDSDAKEA